jgi:hypothetical protein
VFDAVHIGKRTGNENLGHRSDLFAQEDAEPLRNQKALPRDRKGLDSAHAWRENARTIPSGRTPYGRAGAFVSGTARFRKSLRYLQELVL